MTKAIFVHSKSCSPFRFGLKFEIERRHPDIFVIELSTDNTLFSLLSYSQTDIVMLDVHLTDMKYIEVVRRLKKERPEMRILATSFGKNMKGLRQLLEAGIDGYICRNMSETVIDELAAAIRTVISGFGYLDRDIAGIMYDIYVAQNKTTEISSEFTGHEHEILLLCRQGLNANEIANRLALSPEAFAGYKDNIFRKLGVSTTYEIVKKEKINISTQKLIYENLTNRKITITKYRELRDETFRLLTKNMLHKTIPNS
jgi:DNA-binding NarL/FixJ family response regulator